MDYIEIARVVFGFAFIGACAGILICACCDWVSSRKEKSRPVEVPEIEPEPELVWTSFVRVWICEECETPYKMDPAYSSEVTLCGRCGSEEIRQSVGRWKYNPHREWTIRTRGEEFEERKS